MSKPHVQVRLTAEPQPIKGERLDSWKEIARYLNRDVRTVQRWEKTEGLPVCRRSQGRFKGNPVYAFTTEIDAWLRKVPPPGVGNGSEAEPSVHSLWQSNRLIVAILSIAILATGAAIVWKLLQRKPASVPLRVVQLTNYPGMERYPAISPDGKQVAFSWNGENQDNFDLYVKFIDGGSPLRLTRHPGVDGWPAWSPDGRTIAFVRWVLGARNAEVLTVQALGGGERRILEVPTIPQSASFWPILCWTPDGKWIIGSMPLREQTPASMGMISPQTLEVRALLEPAAGSIGDCCPAIAPDGSKIAFLRASAGREWNLHTLALGPDYRPIGEPKQITFGASGVQNPMWTADSREVLYLTEREGERMLWRVPYDGSRAASPIESLGPVGYNWAISPQGDRLVFTDSHVNRDIWRVDLPDCKQVRRIVSSSTPELYPEIAPDGKRIAFISDRERGRGLWVSDLDGANPIYLAPIAGEFPAPARWSPDGNYLVFECQNDGNDDVCTVPAGSGAVRRLTRDPAQDLSPSWSHDGKWIYFSSSRSGLFQIWKIPVFGSESAALRLTKGVGRFPVESMDGTSVFFAREKSSAGIWKTSVGGGEESQVGEFRILGCKAQNFAVTRQGIYYVSSTDPERWFEIWLYRFSSSRTERISRINNKRIWEGLSISPDGSWLAFNATEAQDGDLYMVENFR